MNRKKQAEGPFLFFNKRKDATMKIKINSFSVLKNATCH